MAPAAIPSRIQAQDYSAFGGEDAERSGAIDGPCAMGEVDLNEVSDNDGICHVGWTVADEWLEYELSANSQGLYDLVFRIASMDSGKAAVITLDGVDVGTIEGPANGWQSYSDVRVKNVNISAGQHTLRVTFSHGGINFNYFEFVDPIGNSSSSSSSSSSGAFDVRGHEGPLFGGVTEADRQGYHYQENNGTVVVEAEHFVTQRYGTDDYRGARWWMVQTQSFTAKAHPEFADRCAMAKTELKELEAQKKYGGVNIRDIIAANWNDSHLITYWGPGPHDKGGEPSKGIGGDAVFEQFKCDADENHSNAASEGQYVELLPDVLYGNYNEMPHGASNWKVGTKSPKAYYKVNLTGGQYTIYIRGYRTEADSGSVHIGHTKTVDSNETVTDGRGVSFNVNEAWSWVSDDMTISGGGTRYIILAGREDGFEVDKLVITKGVCDSCNGSKIGPAESNTIK